MGLCFSSTKVSGSSSNNNNNNNASSNRNRKCSAAPAAAAPPEPVTPQKKQPSQAQRRRVPEESRKNPRAKDKAGARRQGTRVPCGKRTDFGYEKDFENRFSLGKLLGHGQFGYTYVGIDKKNGDRVAVKRLEKSKVFNVTSFVSSVVDTQFRFCDRCAVMELNFCSFRRLLQLWFCLFRSRKNFVFVFGSRFWRYYTSNFGAGDW